MTKSDKIAFKIFNSQELFCELCQKTTTHNSLFGSEWVCMACTLKKEEEEQQAVEKRIVADRKANYIAMKATLMAKSGASPSHLGFKHKGSIRAAIKSYCEHVGEMIANGRNIMMNGDAGMGKTTLAMTVALSALKSGYSVFYVKGYDIAESFDDLKHDLLQSDLLIIDELHLGVRMFGNNASTEDQRIFYRIFESRKNRGKCSHVLISNETPSYLSKMFGVAIYDRMVMNSIYEAFEGESYRRVG